LAVAESIQRDKQKTLETIAEGGRIAKELSETAISVGAGDAGDFYTAATGVDPGSGEEVGTFWRVVAGVAAVVPAVAASWLRKGDEVLEGVAEFGGVTARTPDEASFLRNVSATFTDSGVYSSARRFEDQIVVQRSDIPWSVQNVRLAARGNTPFVRNSSGQWERINLHHVGRKEGRLIEVIGSQNQYNNATGGRLHIPGPGGPVTDREFNVGYWQQRLQDAVEAGQVPDEVLRKAGL